jgi:hypothetical protein
MINASSNCVQQDRHEELVRQLLLAGALLKTKLCFADSICTFDSVTCGCVQARWLWHLHFMVCVCAYRNE